MSKSITINWNGSDYTMEFNRKSVVALEGVGFSLNEIVTKPNTMIPLLVQGAFYMHHPNMKQETAMKIFADQSDKVGLIGALREMFVEPTNSLLDEPDEEKAKNSTWVKSW